MKALRLVQHLIEALESLMEESEESLLECQLRQRYAYENHKIIEREPKITQDEIISYPNLSTKLSGTIKFKKLKLKRHRSL